jgi:FtsP/CotA-like multicopper oxidase with cupredoxin domain
LLARALQAGTYFYHGHLAMQRAAGLFGSLIVSLPPGKTEPFSYDGDLSVLLSDWYHKSIYQQELGLSSIPFQFVGEPQVGSLLACLDSLLPSSDHYPFSDSRETLSSLFPELLLLLLLFWIGVVSLLLLLESAPPGLF